MKNILCIKEKKIGEGMPKICVPVTGTTYEEIKEQAEKINNLDIDIIEWRVDFYEDYMNPGKVEKVLTMFSGMIKEKLLLFTFRSAKEGGEKEITPEAYFSLNESAAKTGKVDLIDMELFMTENIKEKTENIHKTGTKVIMSNHDFAKTPTKKVIVERLVRMQEYGADIAKIAVMPKTSGDVLRLLEATNEMKEKHIETPVITMSMSGLGKVSRICGEVFGSAVTFASAGQASAPGQLPVEDMRAALRLFVGEGE